jgi:hypothetical protein
MNRKQIRWTIEQAAAEFNMNPRTLSKRLKHADTLPGEDGCFGTLQIAGAVFGDIEGAQLRKITAEAVDQERKNLVADGKLIDVEEFKADFAPIYVEMVRGIRSSALAEDLQDQLLANLSKLHEIRTGKATT